MGLKSKSGSAQKLRPGLLSELPSKTRTAKRSNWVQKVENNLKKQVLQKRVLNGKFGKKKKAAAGGSRAKAKHQGHVSSSKKNSSSKVVNSSDNKAEDSKKKPKGHLSPIQPNPAKFYCAHY